MLKKNFKSSFDKKFQSLSNFVKTLNYFQVTKLMNDPQ